MTSYPAQTRRFVPGNLVNLSARRSGAPREAERGVAQINVGAATEIEMKEKKARVEDALHATRAAVDEDLVESGVIDPTEVVRSVRRSAVENAASVASLLLAFPFVAAPPSAGPGACAVRA